MSPDLGHRTLTLELGHLYHTSPTDIYLTSENLDFIEMRMVTHTHPTNIRTSRQRKFLMEKMLRKPRSTTDGKDLTREIGDEMTTNFL